MDSAPSPSPMTPQEASDLLHKFITESINVHVMFFAPASDVRLFIRGFVEALPDGTFRLAQDKDPASPRVFFDPRRSSGARYGDGRAFAGTPPEGFFKKDFSSALIFLFPDGSVLVLFEVSDQE
jgi:hypothetical protein